MVAGIHVGLAVLLLADATSPLRNGIDDGRLLGGGWAHTHPNIIATSAWPTAIVWMTLREAPASQRWLGATTMIAVVLLTNSRTSAAALVLAMAAIIGIQNGGLARQRESGFKLVDAAIVTIVVIGCAAAVSQSYFNKARAPDADVLSGREFIWRQTVSDFRAAPSFEKVLGTTQGGSNAEITVDEGGTPTTFVAHNAVLGLLRKSGLVGLGLGAIGLIALLRQGVAASGGRPIAGAAIVAGSLATVPFEAFIFGSALWMWLVAASQMFSQESDFPS